ncbi:hypothetical protein FRB90_004998 [Tulasnella sp. 427]|nr:hypothetical protein FRB90_004998 [Tulasnella sp. 427]
MDVEVVSQLRPTSDITMAVPGTLGSRSIEALKIPEILLAILVWLSRRDQAIAARVSRMWSALALDLIWKTVPEIRHLINTYSELEWTRDYLWVWRFRDISAGGRWDVFAAYARRVQELQSSEDRDFAPDVIHHLMSQAEGSSGLSSFFPKLRSLKLRVDSCGPFLVRALRLVPPSLQSLQVDFTNRFRGAFETLGNLLSYLNAVPLNLLSRVELTGCGEVSDEHLLHLRDELLLHSRTTLVHLDMSLFPITIPDLRRIGSIVPKLKDLKFLGKETSMFTTEEVIDCLNGVGRSFHHLRSIRVSLRSATTPKVRISELIRGLESCQDLRKFDIDVGYFGCPWHILTEADIRYLGSRWPMVESFKLYNKLYNMEYGGEALGSPLALLQEFARVWSRTLQILALNVDTVPPLPDPSTTQPKFERLEMLDVGTSEICREEDIEPIADFLTALSPGPVQIDSWMWGSENLQWGKVGSLVEANFTGKPYVPRLE